MKLIIATTVLLVLGLAVALTDRGPLSLAVDVLLRIQAAVRCAGFALRRATQVYRANYWHYLADAREGAGK